MELLLPDIILATGALVALYQLVSTSIHLCRGNPYARQDKENDDDV